MNVTRPSARRSATARTAAILTTMSLALAGTAVLGAGAGVSTASSHREAPLVAADPQVDNTDVYAFTSPDNPDTVTLVANWLPFQEPNGGPNFYPWADGAHYDINIDSQGTGRPDITYRWTFHTDDQRGTNTFLYNNGPVNNLTDPTLLFHQYYTLQELREGCDPVTLVEHGTAAPSDTGRASMPNYAQLRQQATVQLPGGGQTVATQAADPFFLDLRVFDLLYGANLSEVGQNTLAGYNVNSLSIQVPKSSLAFKGDPTRNPVIGVWSSTEKQTLKLSPGKADPVGKYVQVSRLGNPLVNEVVLPAGLKDAFNSLPPSEDHNQPAVVAKVLDPEVPKLVQAIYGLPAPATPRTDLQEIFLTGIAKAANGPFAVDLNSQLMNQDIDPKRFVPAEELRLNMSTPVTAKPDRLGILAGDFQGFPNGRRLTDDVLDIALQVMEGATPGHLIPALAAGDKVDTADKPFGAVFPYLALPYDKAVNQPG
ncbi:DUF4331 domain-containing protein [Kitasatospora paracochleata]|uniref:DUF4331 domain-containing protein n=1 Tax=Kitasatospora paracochleata TaxID=58354 RepID=A0ABT1J246_9ACTN|nr:DUF4331 domain-containing protein [Kitasatospora paracochleata]MCP2311510.1 hypothetical protein [Kitasatospora paracochleata]